MPSAMELAGVRFVGECLDEACCCPSSSTRDCVSERSVGVPVTMSASQSPKPPRAQSIAVCGLYTC